MDRLSTNDLLETWERGRSAEPFRRALLLLGAALPDCPAEELARLNIGRRDALLLELRQREFGERFSALVNCPVCGETLELSFTTGEIRAMDGLAESITVKSGHYLAQFRLPNSLDLTAAAQSGGQSSREILLSQCAISTTKRGTACSFDELPNRLKDAAAARLGEADPQADVQLALDCPSCRHHWPAPFDIVSFLWAEIEQRAKRLLREVHALASAYGWSEREILALSPQRRQAYLELVMN